ncbi:MAG: hypothetical protein ACJAVI_003640 [Candidatus Azotimanducaceae bacterium]
MLIIPDKCAGFHSQLLVFLLIVTGGGAIIVALALIDAVAVNFFRSPHSSITSFGIKGSFNVQQLLLAS